MAATGWDAPAQSATAGREIVISRVISAPRELGSRRSPRCGHLSRWWDGGFTTTTRAFEFRVGGEWDFVMTDRAGRTTRSGSPGPRSPRRSGSRCCTVIPRRPERLRVGLDVRADGARPGSNAHVFPTKELRDEAAGEVPRDRGRPADPEQPGAYVSEIVRKGVEG